MSAETTNIVELYNYTKLIARRYSSHLSAEELASEAMYRVLNRHLREKTLDDINLPEPVNLYYMAKVIKNIVINESERNYKFNELKEKLSKEIFCDSEVDTKYLEDVDLNKGKFWKESGSNESKESIDKALSALSEEDKAIVLCRVVYDLSYKEISEIFDLSVEAINKRNHRALKKLRAILDVSKYLKGFI